MKNPSGGGPIQFVNWSGIHYSMFVTSLVLQFEGKTKIKTYILKVKQISNTIIVFSKIVEVAIVIIFPSPFDCILERYV